MSCVVINLFDILGDKLSNNNSQTKKHSSGKRIGHSSTMCAFSSQAPHVSIRRGYPQVNKFQQFSGYGHQMSLAGGKKI